MKGRVVAYDSISLVWDESIEVCCNPWVTAGVAEEVEQLVQGLSGDSTSEALLTELGAVLEPIAGWVGWWCWSLGMDLRKCLLLQWYWSLGLHSNVLRLMGC